LGEECDVDSEKYVVWVGLSGIVVGIQTVEPRTCAVWLP
jgi:hypothetical protein